MSHYLLFGLFWCFILALCAAVYILNGTAQQTIQMGKVTPTFYGKTVPISLSPQKNPLSFGKSTITPTLPPTPTLSPRTPTPTPTPKRVSTPTNTPTPTPAPPQNTATLSWKPLVLIYKNTNASYTSQGQTKQMVTSMTDTQLADILSVVQSLPGTISSWSNGYAQMASPTIVYPTRSITSLSAIWDGYWVSPSTIKEDIDQYAPPGTYDTIFAIWRKDDDNGNSINSFGWGWSNAPSGYTNGAGYTVITVPDGKQSFASTNSRGYPGEIFIHEWNHQTTSFYQSKGHAMPDIDQAPSYGYGTDSNNSWQTFLSDVMQGKVKSGSTSLGITQTIWNSATPTHP